MGIAPKEKEFFQVIMKYTEDEKEAVMIAKCNFCEEGKGRGGKFSKESIEGWWWR